MRWPWSAREPVKPSPEAQSAIAAGERELLAARDMVRQAKEIGASLDQSRNVNHYAIALAAVLRGEGPARR